MSENPMNMDDAQKLFIAFSCQRYANPHQGTKLAVLNDWECMSASEKAEFYVNAFNMVMADFQMNCRGAEEDRLCAWESLSIEEKVAIMVE